MKISDKLINMSDSYTINQYDNGYMVEIGGNDSDDRWTNVKIVCNTIDEVLALVKEASTMDRS